MLHKCCTEKPCSTASLLRQYRLTQEQARLRIPSCFGQTVGFLTQTYGGIPDAADAFGVTIKEGHSIVRSSVCDRTSGIVPTP